MKDKQEEDALYVRLNRIESKLDALFNYIGLEYEKVETVEAYHRVVRKQ
jgi:hypothetical protein